MADHDITLFANVKVDDVDTTKVGNELGSAIEKGVSNSANALNAVTEKAKGLIAEIAGVRMTIPNLNDVQGSIAIIKQSLQEAFDTGVISNFTGNYFKALAKMSNYGAQYKAVYNDFKAEQETKALEKQSQLQKIVNTAEQEKRGITQQIADINHSINRNLSERDHLLNMGVSSSSEQYQALKQQVDVLKEARAELEAYRKEYQDYIAYVKEEGATPPANGYTAIDIPSGVRTDTFATVDASSVEAVVDATEALTNSAYVATDSVDGVADAVSAVGDAEPAVAGTAEAVENLADTATQGVGDGGMGEVADGAEGAKESVNKVTLALKALGSHGAMVASVVGVGIGAGIKGAVQGIIGQLQRLRKQSDNTFDHMGKKAKRVSLLFIRSMLGVRGLYMLFRKLKNAVTEAFKSMAQQVPEVNQVLSDFKTQLAQVKGSIGTAFQPIVSAVLPVLTQLLSALSTVMTAIAKFNAVLTGQKYIYKFTASQQEYAKSLKGTGSAAKKATKDLMGFDEINRLSAPNESGGGGAGDTDLGKYEKMDIDPSDAISEFAEKVKEAWKKSDFTEVGQIVGTKLKGGLETAREFFRTDGQTWAHNLASDLSTFINGFVSVDDLGYTIGSTIGAGLNVGITFLSDFYNNTEWEQLGSQIGDAFNGLFDEIDWEEGGRLLSGKFNAVVNGFTGFVNTFNWAEAGLDLSTGLNTAIDGLNVAQLGTTLSNGIIGIFDFAINTIAPTDWLSLGDQIGEGINNIDFKNILGKGTTAIVSVAQGLFDMLVGGIRKTDWIELTNELLLGLGDALGAIWNDGKLIEDLAAGAIGLCKIVVGLVIGTLKTVLWDWIISPLSDALTQEFEKWDTGFIGADIILGILSGIVDALLGIGRWIAENIVNPIIDGICKAFGIDTSNSAMWEIGMDLIDGLLSALTGMWDAISGTFETVKEGILGVFESVKSGISDIWEGIKSTASTVWNGIKTTVVNAVSGIFHTVTTQFTNLKEGVLGIFRFIRDTAGTIWNGLCSVFSTVFETVWQTLQNVFGKIAEFLQWLWDKIVAIQSFFAGDGVSSKVKEWGATYKAKAQSAGIDMSNVPHLATGSVLPPNSPFLAMVGDQSSGTNVEAPLDTIKQAVAEVLLENNELLAAGFEAVVQAIQNKDMSVRIGDKDIAQANDRYNQRLNLMRGTV